ncbi:MAG: hypothetical protein AAGA54_27610 [Myxococcota bacterium]
MRSTTVATDAAGPLQIDVLASPTLCIAADGDANLAPFTATAKFTNRASTPLQLSYMVEPVRSFRAVRVWPEADAGAAVALGASPGAADSVGAQLRSVAPGESLLLSSWTRHHDVIWSEMTSTPASKQQRYVVRFELALEYRLDGDAVAVSKTFDVTFDAVREPSP